MDTTHVSLLERVRRPTDQGAWREFVERYTPLVYGYVRRHAFKEQECDDLVQDTFLAVLRAMPGFEYDPARGRFRHWLLTVTHSRMLDAMRRRARQASGTGDSRVERILADEPDSGAGPQEQVWEAEWRRNVLRLCLEHLRRHMAAHTFEAFRQSAIEGLPAGAVAEALGMSVANVYVCKARALKRAREFILQLEEDDAGSHGLPDRR